MVPSVDMIVDALGYGVMVPAAVTLATLIMVVLWRRWGQGKSFPQPQTLPAENVGEKGRVGGALAAALGLVAGWVALAVSGQLSWDFLNFTDSWHFLLPLALLALAVGAVEWYCRVAKVASWLLRLICAGVASWLLVNAQAAIEPLSPAWYAAVALGVFCLWSFLDIGAGHWPGLVLPALLALVALGMGAVLEFAGILMFAQMSGVLAAVLAGCALFAWWVPSAACRGVVPAVAVLVPGLLFVGYRNHYTEVPPTSFLLMLASPLLLGVTVCLAPKENPGRLWVVLATVATLVPLLAALALAGPLCPGADLDQPGWGDVSAEPTLGGRAAGDHAGQHRHPHRQKDQGRVPGGDLPVYLLLVKCLVGVPALAGIITA